MRLLEWASYSHFWAPLMMVARRTPYRPTVRTWGQREAFKTTDRVRCPTIIVDRIAQAVTLRTVRLRSSHLLILLLLAACGTTGIKPDEKLVSSVTSLPPVQVPVPVRCVKEIPVMPTLTIDPNANVLQRYYAMKALLAAQDEYMLRANAVIQGCAGLK